MAALLPWRVALLPSDVVSAATWLISRGALALRTPLLPCIDAARTPTQQPCAPDTSMLGRHLAAFCRGLTRAVLVQLRSACMLDPPLSVLQAAKHVKHVLGMDEAALCNVHFGSNSHELVGR